MKFLFITLLIFISCSAQAEEIITKEGSKLYSYGLLAIPKSLQKDSCDKYIFADTNYKTLKNGKYWTDDVYFLVEDNCLLTTTGNSKLSNGTVIEFYLEDTFNTNGQRVYFEKDGNYQLLPNGSYQLADGENFKIIYGYIDDYGGFADGKIYHENRD